MGRNDFMQKIHSECDLLGLKEGMRPNLASPLLIFMCQSAWSRQSRSTSFIQLPQRRPMTQTNHGVKLCISFIVTHHLDSSVSASCSKLIIVVFPMLQCMRDNRGQKLKKMRAHLIDRLSASTSITSFKHNWLSFYPRRAHIYSTNWILQKCCSCNGIFCYKTLYIPNKNLSFWSIFGLLSNFEIFDDFDPFSFNLIEA